MSLYPKFITRRSCVVVAIAIFLSAFSAVSSAAPVPVTLDELIAEGLKNSPAIEAMRLATKSVEQRYPQATALDDPFISYTQPIEEIETRLGPNKRSVMLSQKLPFPGKLRLKGDIVNKEVGLSRIALERAARDLVLEIKRAYFDLYYLDKARTLATERINIFEHFSKAERNGYSVGSTSFSDVVSAETRYADAENELILVSELREAAATRLNALLSRDPEYQISSVAEPIVTRISSELKDLYRLAKDHESIAAAGLRVEKGVLKEDLSVFSSKPSFSVGLKYTEIGEPEMSGIADGGKDAFAVTVGMTIPLWNGKNRASSEEARIARMSKERSRAALTDKLNAEVKRAYVDMRSNYQLVKLYSDLLVPKAEKLIDTVEIMYRNGNGSLSDLFESKVMWINFSLAYHRAVSNYMKNRAEIERLTAGFVLEAKEARDD